MKHLFLILALWVAGCVGVAAQNADTAGGELAPQAPIVDPDSVGSTGIDSVAMAADTVPAVATQAAQAQSQPTGSSKLQWGINIFLLLVGAGGLILAFQAKADAAHARREAESKVNALRTAQLQINSDTDQALQRLAEQVAQLSKSPKARPAVAATVAAQPAVKAKPAKPQKRTLYLTRADERGHFVGVSETMQRGNSIFVLTTTNGTRGTFSVIDDADVHRLALMMPTENLTRACTGPNIQMSAGMSRIITDQPGTAALENGSWRVVTPATIHYVA